MATRKLGNKRTFSESQLINSGGTIVDPATEPKQDEIIENQTDGSQKTQIVDDGGTVLDVELDSTKNAAYVQSESLATEAKQDDIIENQTDGTQKTQIADSGGEIATVSDGRLDVNTVPADSPASDAFGRSRISEQETLFDSKQIFDNQPLFWDDQEVSGGSTTSTHSTDTASTTIGVALNTAGNRTRQTFRRFNYQPGKSQLLFLTGILDELGGGTGITRSFGIYDDDNGLFLQDSEGTIQFVRRTSASGSPVDNAVTQANWNLDTMDGNGASGITLDFTKTQILVIDYEWLGVGRVRLGFNVDGVTTYAHEFLNANNLDVVYMSTPNLPLRYEIENDGTGATSTLEHICSSVISEGGSQDIGAVRYASTAGTHVNANVENTIYAIVGIRLKSAQVAETVKLLNAAVQIQTGSDQVEWILKFNPTVAGTFTYNDETNSAVQTATGATANTVTGGTDIAGGFLESGGNQAGNAGSTGAPLDNALILGAAIDGTVDEIVLCARPVGGTTNSDIEGSLTWRELS